MAIAVDKNVGLAKGLSLWLEANGKHLPLSSLRVSCGFREGSSALLPHLTASRQITRPTRYNTGGRLTRPIRFALGRFSTYLVRVPFGIHSDTICEGFIVTPMNGTIFGCLNDFHITTSLKNDCGTRGHPLAYTKTHASVGTNLQESPVIAHWNPQLLDADFPTVLSAFPHVCRATPRDRPIADPYEVTRYGVRGW